jgi:hypothetical protein
MDTSAVKFVVVVGFMLRDVGKIPWNFPWNHRPKRGWFHSIYILGWKVPELWFHGNSMERSSRCPTLPKALSLKNIYYRIIWCIRPGPSIRPYYLIRPPPDLS